MTATKGAAFIVVGSVGFHGFVSRSDYGDYVRALQLDISGCRTNGERILLGKMAADKVLIGDAQVDGRSLFDVCDEGSQGLNELRKLDVKMTLKIVVFKKART